MGSLLIIKGQNFNTIAQYLEHEAFSLPSFEVNKYYIVFHSVPNGFQKWNLTCVVAHLQKPEKNSLRALLVSIIISHES